MIQKNIIAYHYTNIYFLSKKHLFTKYIFGILFYFLATSYALAQNSEPKLYVSLETDPAFWAGTLSNGIGFDANINFRFAKKPKLRFGILGYTGKWSGDFGKTILLTDDFKENNWETQWNGLGIEAQYQFRLGLSRGGLQPGLRLQWNQFLYHQQKIQEGEANHLVITPQVGFQWFPFKKIGLYILPWAGAQIPISGTEKIDINQEMRQTQKIMPIITAHIGWEFSF